MSDEEFAFWSENALWLHEQMSLLKQGNTLAAMGGAGTNR